MTTIAVHTNDYNRMPITRIELDGRPVWLVREIGGVLGYARTGDKLARNIAKRWASFNEGTDFCYLDGPLLEKVRGLVPRLRRTRRVMVLFAQGLERVLARSPLHVGGPLRDWLWPLSEISALEAKRLELEEARERRLATENRVRGLLILLDAVSETATAEDLRVYQIKLAQELAERDFTSLLPAKGDRWKSPSEIARRNEATLHRVGQIISELGLRDPEKHPDLCAAYDNLAPKSGRVVTCYRYSPEAVAEIESKI